MAYHKKLTRKERSKIGRRAKNKGAGFERKCAKMILKAAGPKFTKDDCFRTPLSGGHPRLDKCDLTYSRKLIKIFPFSTEMKHQKSWKLPNLYNLTVLFLSWVEQSIRAAKKDKKFHRTPAVIWMGNGTPIFCAIQDPLPVEYAKRMTTKTHLRFWHTYEGEEKMWRVFLFSDVLSVLHRLGKKVGKK